MQQSETINELAVALCKCQSELTAAKKRSENPFFKSSYADLSEIWDAARKPLADNGLSVVQTMDGSNGDVVIVTTLLHNSGQWIRGRLPIHPVKNDPQAVGSAITYGRRYSLSAIIGLVTEADDDGESAMDRGKKEDPQITEDQLLTITTLMSDTGSDEKKFLKYLKVDKLDTMPQSKYPGAIAALEKKKGKPDVSA